MTGTAWRGSSWKHNAEIEIIEIDGEIVIIDPDDAHWPA